LYFRLADDNEDLLLNVGVTLVLLGLVSRILIVGVSYIEDLSYNNYDGVLSHKVRLSWLRCQDVTYHIPVLVLEGILSDVLLELFAVVDNNKAFLDLLDKGDIIASAPPIDDSSRSLCDSNIKRNVILSFAISSIPWRPE
jgi:hypothetical protein